MLDLHKSMSFKNLDRPALKLVNGSCLRLASLISDSELRALAYAAIDKHAAAKNGGKLQMLE